MKSVFELTNDELEDCVDGSTDIQILREILNKQGVVDEQGWVDPEIFADWFATGIEGYIDAERDSEVWTEAYNNNWNWGYDIGDNINSYISDNFKNDEQ